MEVPLEIFLDQELQLSSNLENVEEWATTQESSLITIYGSKTRLANRMKENWPNMEGYKFLCTSTLRT